MIWTSPPFFLHSKAGDQISVLLIIVIRESEKQSLSVTLCCSPALICTDSADTAYTLLVLVTAKSCLRFLPIFPSRALIGQVFALTEAGSKEFGFKWLLSQRFLFTLEINWSIFGCCWFFFFSTKILFKLVPQQTQVKLLTILNFVFLQTCMLGYEGEKLDFTCCKQQNPNSK